jgi:hypothetical protein
MERADEVFAAWVVDGDLAADGRIDHRQKRGRQHDQGQAAIIGGSGQTGQIADDSAAQGDDRRLPIGG